jgi:hypothetical protein
MHVKCAEPSCTLTATVQGLCERHYNLWYKATTRARPTSLTPQTLSAMAMPPLTAPHQCDDECHVGWLAGLLEGEGCFTTTRSGAYTYPVIYLQMCTEETVQRAARILGAPAVTRRDPIDERWRPTFVTKVGGSVAAEWMRRLRLLMGSRRRAAIDGALAVYDPQYLVNPPRTCVVPRCHEPHEARGLCHKHYMSWLRDRERGRVPRVTSLR